MAHDTYQDEWHFVTVLRNPVERWLSHYRYNHIKNKILLPIEDYVKTRMGVSFGRAFVDEVTEDVDKEKMSIEKLTNIAIERYQRFYLVGTINDTLTFTKNFEQ